MRRQTSCVDPPRLGYAYGCFRLPIASKLHAKTDVVIIEGGQGRAVALAKAEGGTVKKTVSFSLIIFLCWCHMVMPGRKKRLVEAIQDGDLRIVQRMVNCNPDLVKYRTKNGKTLLHYAVMQNNAAIEEFLLSRGADINACDDWGNSPLIDAVINSCTHVVASLLRANPDCDTRGYMGRTALYHACYNNDIVSVHLLLNAEANTQIPDIMSVTPLHVAALNGCYDAARLLIRSNAPQDAQDEKGRTPLHYAAIHKRPDIAELLLEYDGKFVDALDGFGSTPLHYAAELGELSLVRLLILRHGASCITNNLGHTPIDRALSHNSFVILNFFYCYGLPIPNRSNLQLFYPDCKEILTLCVKRLAAPLVHLLRKHNLDVLVRHVAAEKHERNEQRLSELLLAFLFCDTNINKQVTRRLEPVFEPILEVA